MSHRAEVGNGTWRGYLRISSSNVHRGKQNGGADEVSNHMTGRHLYRAILSAKKTCKTCHFGIIPSDVACFRTSQSKTDNLAAFHWRKNPGKSFGLH